MQDLLDVARLQAGRFGLKKERVDLRRVVVEVADSFAPVAAARGVLLVVDAPDRVPVEGDAKRLGQVLYNLVGNAVTFTPAGGRVAVRCRRDGLEAIALVDDTGAGLTPEQLGRLFQPFLQVDDAHATVVGGRGLGLFVSQGLVDLHGGRIWAESGGPGRGSTFGFAVPADLAAGPAAADAVARLPAEAPAAD